MSLGNFDKLNLTWHYFVLTNTEYAVLGYNPKKNDMLCVSLTHLHASDKSELLRIIKSDEAQKTPYLVSILVNHSYAGGGTWWEHLQSKIFFAGLGQIRGRIPEAQMKMFMDNFYEHMNKTTEKHDPIILNDSLPHVDVEDTVIRAVVNYESETTNTGNIDDILFGPVLSLKDREDIEHLKRLAGLQ